ncbi:hypothetical protein [Kibdelosporangium philippinense]|uniref:hypothetical protein n=1 Tax=Kibdelosporangium philippinense TaxID=211113 RepID=UPI003619EA20
MPAPVGAHVGVATEQMPPSQPAPMRHLPSESKNDSHAWPAAHEPGQTGQESRSITSQPELA